MSLPYPVFTFAPDFTDPPRYGVSGAASAMSTASAESFVTFPHDEPERQVTLNFVLDTAAEITGLKDFFLDRGGATRPFYLPSWRDDLVLVETELEYLVVEEVTIPAGHGDHYSRTVFVWQDGQLHVTRWTSYTTALGLTSFTLEEPVPFATTPGAAMVGFAYLARFGDDRLAWRHALPDCAELTVTFRSPRQWSSVRTVDSVTPVVFNKSPGFATATAVADALTPIEHRVTYCMGTPLLGTPDALDTRWAVWIHTDGFPRMKATVSDITLPDATGVVCPEFVVDIATTWVTAAFDHDGVEYVGYQEGASVFLRYGGFGFSWPGFSPVLANNYFTNEAMATSEAEVVCFYLKPGENVLYARYKSEDFDDEHAAALLPFKPLELRALDFASKTALVFSDAAWRQVTLTIP